MFDDFTAFKEEVKSRVDIVDVIGEFIELKNIGAETISLNLVTFTNGIDFTFGSTSLDPNQYILVVEDQSESFLLPPMPETFAGPFMILNSIRSLSWRHIKFAS